MRVVCLLLAVAGSCQAYQPPHITRRSTILKLPGRFRGGAPLASEPPEGLAETDSTADDKIPPPPAAPAAPAQPAAFDLKAANAASAEKPFNQFDPVLSITGFLSRRFGIFGGLAIVGLLAATEGNEILKSMQDTGPMPGSGETITTKSGLQYVDVLIGTSGDSPKPGNIVGFNAVVKVGDTVLFDTTKDKPVAFKLGQRPFQNVVCAGLEEGVQGMKVGGKRKLIIPQDLAPPGVKLPKFDDGTVIPVIYDIELTEVLQSYL